MTPAPWTRPVNFTEWQKERADLARTAAPYLVSRAAELSRGPSTFQSGQKSCQNLEKGFRGSF
jgi:hypothetical protein